MRLMLSYSIRQFVRKVNNNKQKQYANKFACLLTVQKWSRKRGSASVAASASERAAVNLKRTAATSAWLTQLPSSLSLAQPASQLLGLLITVNRLPYTPPPPTPHSFFPPAVLLAFNQPVFISISNSISLLSLPSSCFLFCSFCFALSALPHTHSHTHTQAEACRHFRIFVSVSLYLYLRYSSCACVAEPIQAESSPKSICGMQPHGEISVQPVACCKCVLHAYTLLVGQPANAVVAAAVCHVAHRETRFV